MRKLLVFFVSLTAIFLLGCSKEDSSTVTMEQQDMNVLVPAADVTTTQESPSLPMPEQIAPANSEPATPTTLEAVYPSSQEIAVPMEQESASTSVAVPLENGNSTQESLEPIQEKAIEVATTPAIQSE